MKPDQLSGKSTQEEAVNMSGQSIKENSEEESNDKTSSCARQNGNEEKKRLREMESQTEGWRRVEKKKKGKRNRQNGATVANDQAQESANVTRKLNSVNRQGVKDRQMHVFCEINAYVIKNTTMKETNRDNRVQFHTQPRAPLDALWKEVEEIINGANSPETLTVLHARLVGLAEKGRTCTDSVGEVTDKIRRWQGRAQEHRYVVYTLPEHHENAELQ